MGTFKIIDLFILLVIVNFLSSFLRVQILTQPCFLQAKSTSYDSHSNSSLIEAVVESRNNNSRLLTNTNLLHEVLFVVR